MDWNEVFKGRLAPLCVEVIRARFPGELNIASENCGEDRKGYAIWICADQKNRKLSYLNRGG